MDTNPDEPTVVAGTRDRRAAMRVPVRATVTAVNRSEEINGWIADLSITGIFINSNKHFEAGEAVLIKMCIAELGAIYDVIVGGTVVRCPENGMGIHFNKLSASTLELIENLVKRIK